MRHTLVHFMACHFHRDEHSDVVQNCAGCAVSVVYYWNLTGMVNRLASVSVVSCAVEFVFNLTVPFGCCLHVG